MKRMQWKRLYKYFKAYALGMQNSMEYRADFFLSMLSIFFPVLIQLFLWTAIFKNSQGGTVYGYTYGQMISYAVLAGIVSKVVAAGFEWEVAGDVKNGGLDKYIIKPIDYFQYRISCFLGQKTIQLTIMLLLTALVLAILHRSVGLVLEPLRILAFVGALIPALLLNFLIAFCLSTAAFWLSEVWGVFIVSSLLVNIVSGGIFPLDIFGEKLLRLFDLLPFKYTIYYPVNILNGKMGWEGLLSGTLIQCAWIAALTLLAGLLWNAGSRKYVAVGG